MYWLEENAQKWIHLMSLHQIRARRRNLAKKQVASTQNLRFAEAIGIACSVNNATPVLDNALEERHYSQYRLVAIETVWHNSNC